MAHKHRRAPKAKTKSERRSLLALDAHHHALAILMTARKQADAFDGMTSDGTRRRASYLRKQAARIRRYVKAFPTAREFVDQLDRQATASEYRSEALAKEGH